MTDDVKQVMPWRSLFFICLVVLTILLCILEYTLLRAYNDRVQEASAALEEKYMASEFKVVAIADNPFYGEGESLAERSHALYVITARGTNDYTCGGMYVPSTCHFFLETSYYQTPARLFVGSWTNEFAALDRSSIRFLDSQTVEFEARNGDAGVSVRERWQLDLETGNFTRVGATTTKYDAGS